MSETSSVRLADRDVPYVVVRSARARLVRLRIGPDPVVRIIAPQRHRLGRIEDVLEPHRRWIFKHLDRLKAILPAPKTLQDGDTLPFLGVDRTLDARPDGHPAIRLADDRILVRGVDPADLAGVLESWYRRQARYFLTDRTAILSRQMRVTYTRITIRDQRTRWGSCSSRGTLSFNWRLIMAPEQICDYLVVHELAHLAVPNHSHAFWDLVERHCPDRKMHERWLRDNGDRLASYLLPHAH